MHLHRPLIWLNGPATPRAAIIAAKTWEEYKDVIHTKYPEMQLAELIEWMAETYNFVATYALQQEAIYSPRC